MGLGVFWIRKKRLGEGRVEGVGGQGRRNKVKSESTPFVRYPFLKIKLSKVVIRYASKGLSYTLNETVK